MQEARKNVVFEQSSRGRKRFQEHLQCCLTTMGAELDCSDTVSDTDDKQIDPALPERIGLKIEKDE